MVKVPRIDYLFPHKGWNRLTIVLCTAHLIIVAFWVVNERNSINPYEKYVTKSAAHEFWEWTISKHHPKTWGEVMESDEYRALNPSDQMAARRQYLQEVIAQKAEYRSLSHKQKLVVDDAFLASDEGGPWEDYMAPQERLVLQQVRAVDNNLRPRVGNIFKVALLPPLALAFLIYSGLWVYRGFRTAR